MKKINLLVFCMVFAVVLFSSVATAGIGIVIGQESLMLNEGEEGKLSVGVYNPFAGDSNVIIEISEELKEVLVMQEAEAKLIPAHTSSEDAIPVEFHFKVPKKVYERDYTIAGRFIDELKCEEEQKVYEGEIVVKSVPLETSYEGTGGSATQMAIGHPMRVRVNCNPYGKNYTLLYVFVALVSGLVIFMVLFKKYRTPKLQRDKEKLAKLRAEIRKQKKN